MGCQVRFNMAQSPGHMGFYSKRRDTQSFAYLGVSKVFMPGQEKNFLLLHRQFKQCLLQ